MRMRIMNESVKAVQAYIETPEGSAWFMDAVGKAVQGIETTKARKEYAGKKGYTLADFNREREQWKDNEQRRQDAAAIKIVVSKARLTEVIQYRRSHVGEKDSKYRPYLTNEETPRLEFYLDAYMNGGYPGNLKFINIDSNQYDKILNGEVTRIHDKFLKPYYFNVVMVE
jgi:hypothetical protein